MEVFNPSSSNIESIEYDSKDKKMHVTFRGGRKYVYHDVPETEFLHCKECESVGSHFNSEISRKYRFTKP